MTKERIYSMIREYQYGDFIKCTNCGTRSLVKSGINVCPSCEVGGCNTWVDEDNNEYTNSEVIDIGNTEIVYLSDERCDEIEEIDSVL